MEVTWHVTFDGLDTELRSGHLGSLTSSAPGLLLSLWAAPVAQFANHPLSQTFQLEALELPLPLWLCPTCLQPALLGAWLLLLSHTVTAWNWLISFVLLEWGLAPSHVLLALFLAHVGTFLCFVTLGGRSAWWFEGPFLNKNAQIVIFFSLIWRTGIFLAKWFGISNGTVLTLKNKMRGKSQVCLRSRVIG